MPIRPEAERKLRAGFQRRVDEQSARYAGPLAHAGQLAERFECGQVVAVFTGRAGGGVRGRAYVVGLLPLAAIPLLIAGAAARVPGMLPLLGAFPFLVGAWFGVSLIRGRERKRDVWFYAFTEGFMLLDGAESMAAPARWNEIAEVGEVWTDVYSPSAEESRPALTAWRLTCADGRAYVISRAYHNVRDPYREVGQLLTGLMPGTAGQVLPKFPTVDQVISGYAGRA